jgi:small subunit ribosomal protein S18
MSTFKKKNLTDFFINNKNIPIDYKNTNILKKFISPEGKILPSRRSGLVSKNHRKLAKAIKRARMINLFPFINQNN